MGSGCVAALLAVGWLGCAPALVQAGGSSVPIPSESTRTYAWRRLLDDGSFEHATVHRRESHISITGTILTTHAGRPLRVDYTLTTDPVGFSRSLTLEQRFGSEFRRLVLVRSSHGEWSVDGRPAAGLSGYTDIDLGLSPSTNALPLSRLASAPDRSAEIRAAWVRFPTLEVTPALQRYSRIGERRWRYESLASGFTAILEVDDWGLPTHYEGVWTRVGMTLGAAAGESDFASALVADGASPELGAHAADFDWLVGGWSATVRDIGSDGSVRRSRGEWWFAWVLEGRAMQDVWISPPRGEREEAAQASTSGNRYGTTLRQFDHRRGAWRITWMNPVTGAESQLAGVRRGDSIVLLGMAEGRPVKWQFVDIKADRFTWQGYRLGVDGQAWELQAEFKLQRTSPLRGEASGVDSRP
jgi:hypothetical protein